MADAFPKTAKVTAFFGDAEHVFTLQPHGVPEPLALIEELQEKSGVGPFRLFNTIRTDDFRAQDIREVIRLGLIGGGKSASEAHKLVGRHFDREPIADHAELALEIMTGMLFGFPVLPVEVVPVEPEVAA